MYICMDVYVRMCVPVCVDRDVFVRVMKMILCLRPRKHPVARWEDDPKLRPTTACQVGLYFLSNSFLMNAAMSFSMLYRARPAALVQNM